MVEASELWVVWCNRNITIPHLTYLALYEAWIFGEKNLEYFKFLNQTHHMEQSSMTRLQ